MDILHGSNIDTQMGRMLTHKVVVGQQDRDVYRMDFKVQIKIIIIYLIPIA